MNSTGSTSSDQIEDLKKEIAKLKQEIKELNAGRLHFEERKKVEEEAITRTTELEAILSCIADGVIVYDKQGRIVRMNAMAEKMLNYPEEETKLEMDKRISRGYNVWTEDGRQLKTEEMPAFRASVHAETIKNEVLLIKGKEDPHWISISAAPLIVSGTHIGGVASLSDITDRKKAEAALRTGEAQMDAFFSNSPAILNLVDGNFCYINTDRITPTYYGLNRETIKGKRLQDLSKDFMKQTGAVMQRVIETGEPILDALFESPLPGKEGEVAYWRTSFFRVPLGDEKWGVGVISIEITDIKRSEIKLRESEERFRAMADNISQFAWIANKEGKVIWFNKRWLDYTGVTGEEMQGKGRSRVHHPEHSERVLNSYMAAIIKGEPWEDTYPLKGKDGNYRWFLARALPIRDENDNITYWFGTNTDIHEQKLSEDKAHSLASELDAILKNVPVGVLVYDTNVKVVRSNKAANNYQHAKEYFSLPFFEGVDKLEVSTESGDFLKPEELPAYRAAKKKETVTNQKFLFKKDSEILWLNVSAAPLNIDGKHSGAVLVMSDITQSKEAENALKESEERFRALVSASSEVLYRMSPDWSEMQQLQSKNFLANTEKPNDQWLKEYIPAEDQQHVTEVINESIRTKRVFELEHRIWGADGSIGWTFSRAVPLLNGNGEIVEWFGAASDITTRKHVEEALRESEQRLKAIFEQAAIGICEVDHENKFITVNNKICEILGYSRPELLGKRLDEITSPEDLRISLEVKDKLQKGELDTVDIEKRYIKRDGSHIWAHVTISAVHSQHGLITIRTIEDITDRKRAEGALKESEERFSTMFKSLSIGVSLLTYPEFIMYDVNQAWIDLLGFAKKEEVVGRSVLELGGLFSDPVQRKKNLKELALKRYLRNADTEVITKKGDTRIITVSLDLVYINGKRYILSTMPDITDMKLAEKRLKEALSEAEEGRNTLAAVMEYIPMGITLADAPDVNIRMVSRYGQEILEKSSDEIAQIPAPEHPSKWGIYRADAITPGTSEELPLTRATTKGEIVKNEEWYVTRKDGTLIPILCNAAPIRDKAGKVVGGIIGWQDIAGLKRIEQEMKQRNEELTRFIYTVSHDLKSPLVTIKMFTSYLRDDINIPDKAGQEEDLG
jgi:PAS domain S-box-containing protein